MSMGKRSEVDKRVAQEIKNHSDRVDNLNCELQDLKKEIKSLKESIILHKAQANQSLQAKSIESEIHRDKLDMLYRDLKNEVSECLKSISESREVIRKYIEACDGHYVKAAQVETVIKTFNLMISEMSLRIERNYSAVESKSNENKNYVQSQINTVLKEIEDAPNHFEAYANQVDALLEENTVNINGFRGEIEKLKKEHFVNARNIEALIHVNKELLCRKKE